VGGEKVMEEVVTLKLSTYDQLLMKISNLQDEVKTLRNALDSIRVFELEDGYNGNKKLIYTDFALKQYAELVDGNPHLEFKELKKIADWDIANPKPEVVEEDD
jgi:hypothetical protein